MVRVSARTHLTLVYTHIQYIGIHTNTEMPYFVSYHILYYMMLDLHGFLLSSDQIVQGMMCVHERYGTVCVCV